MLRITQVSSPGETTGLPVASNVVCWFTRAIRRTSIGSEAPLLPSRRNTMKRRWPSGNAVSLGLVIAAEIATRGSGARPWINCSSYSLPPLSA
nr:hypothetical protein [Bradyrhizobium sp. 2S1]MCK7671257.1 hypothetical protein [Bradyrhizobium sp. 2S1]